jgi:hypothetical protein
MHIRLFIIAVFAAIVVAQPAAAEQFQDRARVLDTQAVYSARAFPVQARECGYEAPATPNAVDPAMLGDARAIDPGADLLSALQRDMELRESPEQVYRCHNVTRTEYKDVLAGYRVRYEYQGRIYERQLAERPGETIEVSVRMNADVARFR